jgi:tetratricopeptide (TPR) repeat protein
MRIRLPGSQRERLVRKHTEDIEAHSLYLEGRFFWNQRKADGIQKAMELFKRAIEKDTEYPLPYVGIADCFSMLGTYGFMAPREAFPQARMAARRALDLCDDLGEAQATLGWVSAIHDFEWDTAMGFFAKAQELSPSYASTYSWRATALMAQGDLGQALQCAQRAQQLDPLSLIINANLGLFLVYMGQPDAAIAQLRRTLELERRFPPGHMWLGAALLVKGDYDGAVSALTDGMQVGAYNSFTVGHLVAAYAALGQLDKAQETFKRFDSLPQEGYRSPYSMAVACFALGEMDRAFELMEQAYQERDTLLVFAQGLRGFPSLKDRILPDPRWDAFLDKMGLSL